MHKKLLRELNYIEAIREALDLLLEKDQSTIIIGEGVPDPKSIFNSTIGLQEKYGKNRVFDMPLSENGLSGICIGAALSGLRPIMIHQRIDFSLLAMDQIINNAAKWHYMFNGKASVPLVIRMIIGRGWGQGPQHSQSLQSMFASVPGLKVVMPTTPADAKGMLISATEDNNPVIFIEHRWLHHVSDYVPEGFYRTPLDKSRLLKEGNDVTIAAFSLMSFEALIAAECLEKHMGIHVDLIDMRSVRPLDVNSVINSVKKTNLLLVADTALKTGCVAGELICQVLEIAFNSLKKAPLRIASPDHPLPTSPYMSVNYYPGPREIAEAVIDLVGCNRDTVEYNYLCNDLLSRNEHDVPNKNFKGPF